MLKVSHQTILTELLTLPTAPFAEHAVLSYIRLFCSKRPSAALTADRFGNLVVRVRKGGRRVARHVCFTAHTDHPGFVAMEMLRPGRLKAQWRGGVPAEYFQGAKVRFAIGGAWVKGVVRSLTTIHDIDRLRVDTVHVDVPSDVPAGSVGMWDFPDPQIRGTRIFARGCDDVAGVAALLCAVHELDRGRQPVDAYFLFTRAEEVGFVGAIEAAKARTIPRSCRLVCMETSSERINAKIGDGPILRVGDKSSIFTPELTAWCDGVARELAEKDNLFTYQRKLMDGGTCESSAFCTLGYEATGLCLALGNYHNVDAKRRKLAPEYIDLRDFGQVVTWFVALARSNTPYTGRDELLAARLAKLSRTYSALLRKSVKSPA